MGMVLLLVAAFAALMSLGIWQVHRLAWKRALIAAVDSRIHAAPVAPPTPAKWSRVNDTNDAYRRVRIAGRFDHRHETFVRAVTDLGGGYWVMTPLRTDSGYTVLVNRGFVTPELRDPATRKAGLLEGETTITGLLRITEPKGGFLRNDDPASGRWYSRDVAAIAQTQGLGAVAPYFIDADDTPNPGGFPVGGLTVVSFPNNHLSYAATWFTMAALVAGAGIVMAWRGRRSR
ncbi:Surfeit locus 1 family protein [Sphingobium sp. LB126]|uniref:SURF1 family protein n=1 Tax=Sphingobium sp. LB126 TaxID=1983755 RepID=UPI000C2003BD|nr:SURF1 family protein [Sphingobium sp. LB126]PJG47162.1 Surfeit locus 1 family protein [Sphingobium sp. LB126]